MLRRTTFWIFVIVLALSSVGAIATWHWIKTTPDRVLQNLQQKLNADYNTQLQVFFQTNAIHRHNKLVVAELENVISGSFTSEKTWLGIDMGDTSLDYRMPVRLFYAVDLSSPTPIRFQMDPEARSVTAIFPGPELLAVEPELANAEKRLQVGWGRTKAFSGESVREDFDRNIMGQIRRQAESEAMLSLVRETARKQLAEFVHTWLVEQNAWGARGVRTVRIHFADEPAPTETDRFTLRYQGPDDLEFRDWWPLQPDLP